MTGLRNEEEIEKVNEVAEWMKVEGKIAKWRHASVEIGRKKS